MSTSSTLERGNIYTLGYTQAKAEAHLERLFPNEFRDYRSRVPRFFPRLTLRFHRSFSLDLYLYNREYNTVLGLAGALAVMALKHWLG